MVLLMSLLALASDDHAEVRGITVSTPTYGPEWGSPAMERTLDRLAELGVNWIAYHPYAAVQTDGSVGGRRMGADPSPAWVVAPIEAAHARGIKVLVKPHLAHWGSGFSWRGDIRFDDPEAEARFFREYTTWITAVAERCKGADAFAVGTELDGTVRNEAAWREVIASVRGVFPGNLTFASNWDQYEQVPFWDALDTIGIQAYFPVASGGTPSDAELEAGWDRVLRRVGEVSERYGKPVVFTELGYDASPMAAAEPWASGTGGEDVQERALSVALRRVAADPTVRGAFLWKWFPGELEHGDFRLSRPEIQELIRGAWGRRPQ
ncbi:MAG: hypothetical protein R3F61_20610 [Myxococcota bacterium]